MKLRKNQNGQGMTEFALILPLLLLLLLGIVEGARIIWAYVTVQNAAKEAARYAVTGRPFACGTDPIDYPGGGGAGNPADWRHFCDDPAFGDPWSTQVLSSTRVAAIKQIAMDQGANLAVSQFAFIDVNDFNNHKNTSGAFGVAVIGQSANFPAGQPNFAGDPGWNVRVETYYNIEMLDPIYDTIMGGTLIHLAGEVELQNEGTDSTAKEYVGGITFESDSCAPNCGGAASVPFISVQDEFGDLLEPAGGSFSVSVNDHVANTTYELWFVKDGGGFTDKKIFTTDGLGRALVNFNISVSAPPGVGVYKIYTTIQGGTSPVATCLTDGVVNAPCFSVDAAQSTLIARNKDQGDELAQPDEVTKPRWPLNSSIPIYLEGHNINDVYTLKFNNKVASAAPGTLFFKSSVQDVIQTGDLGSNKDGEAGYYIATSYGSLPTDIKITSHDGGGTEIADDTIELIEGRIDTTPYPLSSLGHPADDIVTVVLRNHAPLQRYKVFFDDGITPFSVVRANKDGELNLNYVVPNSIHTPSPTNPSDPNYNPPVPVEIYTMDHGRGSNPNKIASKTIPIFTPIDPYLNVPGGARWPAGSSITIQVRQHEASTEYELRLQQGDPGSPSYNLLINGATFITDPDAQGKGEKDIAFDIPADTPAGFYTIRSFKPGSTDVEAKYDIEIISQPYIAIDNGNRWPPGSKITIRLFNHVINNSYDVWLDRGGPQEAKLDTVIIAADGVGVLENYTIPESIPNKIEPGYDLHSYTQDTDIVVADNADLEIQAADLIVTQIEVPNVTFNVEVPITWTISNQSPVTITNTYFDTDLYIDPDTGAPNPLDGGLPPGDYKKWINNVPPSGTVKIADTIVLYGQQTHQIYARADTSRNIVETSEANNVTPYVVDAVCPVTLADEFAGDGLAEWTQTSFGSAGPACPTLPGLSAPGGGSAATILGPISDGDTSQFGSKIVDPAVAGTSGTQANKTTFAKHDNHGSLRPSVYLMLEGNTNSENSVGVPITFNNTQPNVTISFSYFMRLRYMEPNEWGRFYLYIDKGNTGTYEAYNGSDGLFYEAFGTNGSQWQNNPSNVGTNDSNWPTANINLTGLSSGSHTLLFVVKGSPRSAGNERVYGYVDNLEVTEQGSIPSPPSINALGDPVGTSAIAEYHFNPTTPSDPSTLSFERGLFTDTFGNTSTNSNFSEGSYVTSDGAWGPENGALNVRLGKINGSTNASNVAAGYSTNITVPAGTTCVTVRGYYRLVMPSDYDGGEFSQVMLSIGTPGSPGYVEAPVSAQYEDNGSGVDTGWVAFNVTVPVSPGTHKLSLGGYNSGATTNTEVTDIWLDDVYIVSNSASSGGSTQAESGGALVLTNNGLDIENSDDNDNNAGYHYMHQTVGSGPFEVYVRLDQAPANGSDGLAGLEIRSDETDGTSSKIAIALRSDNRLKLYRRISGNSTSDLRTQSGISGPVWVKVARNGDEWEFFYVASASEAPPVDWGNAWHTLSNFTIPDSVEVGLFNAPGSSNSFDARFKHFHVCATSAPGGSAGSGGQGLLGSRCGQVEENGNGLVVIDAINTIINTPGNAGHTWKATTLNNVLGEPTMDGMEASPNSGANAAVGDGPHATYQANIETDGTYYVWVAGLGQAGGDDVHVGLNGAAQGVVSGLPTGSADWVQMPGSVSMSAGINTVDLWMKQDGAIIFKILLTTNAGFVPPPNESMSQSACTIISTPHIPPLLEQCTDIVDTGNFEGTFADVTGKWHTTNLATAYSTVNYQSKHGAGFPVFGGRKPTMAQTAVLPSWILSNTTATLNLQKAVDLQAGSTPTDKLFFVLRRASDGFNLAPPVEIATGEDMQPTIPDMDPLNPKPEDFTVFDQNIFAGINPLSVLEGGDSVQIYFYTEGGADTSFFIDDVRLNVCTTQPEPAVETGKGKVSGKAFRAGVPAAGASVWAYAYATDDNDPGPVFQTYAIGDGTYRFFNLPPGDYLIYAQMTDGSGTFSDTRLVRVTANGEVKNVILNINVG